MKEVIVQNGDPVLRKIAPPVGEKEFSTKELDALIERMAGALDKERDGVALAAPQIGVSKRLFIVRYDRLHSHPENATPEVDLGIYINPEFVKSSRRRIEMEEGCLSVRRVYGKALRHERATIKAQAPNGTVFERGGGGILAQIFQHEIDHLNGILFVDHATDLMEIRPEQFDSFREERRARRLEKEHD